MKRCQAVLSPARALVAQGGGLQGEGWNEAWGKIWRMQKMTYKFQANEKDNLVLSNLE